MNLTTAKIKEKEEKPKKPNPEKSDVRIAMETGDWETFFTSLTKLD